VGRLAADGFRGYNFAVADETEIKFAVRGFTAIRRALKARGAKYVSTVIQTDRFFDTADKSLLACGSGLRVRQTRMLRSAGQGVDARPLFTFKGPIARGRRAKIRRELQTHCDRPAAMEQILRAIGMKDCITVKKRRTSYRLGRCLVELDEVERLGRFVEIEGPGEQAVLAVGEKLNLAGESITMGYAEMLSARRGR